MFLFQFFKPQQKPKRGKNATFCVLSFCHRGLTQIYGVHNVHTSIWWAPVWGNDFGEIFKKKETVQSHLIFLNICKIVKLWQCCASEIISDPSLTSNADWWRFVSFYVAITLRLLFNKWLCSLKGFSGNPLALAIKCLRLQSNSRSSRYFL